MNCFKHDIEKIIHYIKMQDQYYHNRHWYVSCISCKRQVTSAQRDGLWLCRGGPVHRLHRQLQTPVTTKLITEFTESGEFAQIHASATFITSRLFSGNFKERIQFA